MLVVLSGLLYPRVSIQVCLRLCLLVFYCVLYYITHGTVIMLPEEVNIPSVEGCEIKLLERCLSHGQG